MRTVTHTIKCSEFSLDLAGHNIEAVCHEAYLGGGFGRACMPSFAVRCDCTHKSWQTLSRGRNQPARCALVFDFGGSVTGMYKISIVALLALGVSATVHAQPMPTADREPSVAPDVVSPSPAVDSATAAGVPAEAYPPTAYPPTAYPPAAYPPPPQNTAPPATAVFERGVMEDANSDRGLLAPTALTPPAGSFSFTNYEIFWMTASYSPTDNLQFTLGTAVPLASDMPFVGTLSAKLQLVKSNAVRLALHGTIGGGIESGSGGSAGLVGGVLTYCLDDQCLSHLNGYVGAGFAVESSGAVPMVVAASGVFRLTNRLRAVVEIDTAYIAGEFASTSNSFLANYALRFTGPNLGVDFGFMKLFVDGDDVLKEVPLGIPFLSFTYRGGPNF